MFLMMPRFHATFLYPYYPYYPYYRVLLSFKIIYVAGILFPCSTNKKAVATVTNSCGFMVRDSL
jgi:hypothetical protein